jgi:hypothetical protein
MENIQVCVLGSAILIFLVIYVCIFSGLFTIESFDTYDDCSEFDGESSACMDRPHCEWKYSAEKCIPIADDDCSEFDGASDECRARDHCEWKYSAEKCIPIATPPQSGGCAAHERSSDCSTDSNCMWTEGACFSPVDPVAELSNTPKDVVDVCKEYEGKDMCKFARDKWNRPCRWLKPWDSPSSGGSRECAPDWTDSSEFPVSDCNVNGGPDEKFWENSDYVKSSCGGHSDSEHCNKAMWYKSNNNPTHGNCEWRGNNCKRRTHTNQRFNCNFSNNNEDSAI